MVSRVKGDLKMKMKMKMKMKTLAVSLLFFGSTSVYAGAFDLANDLEIGIGLGLNTNYWNIGRSKIGPRAGLVSLSEKTNGAGIAQGLTDFAGALVRLESSSLIDTAKSNRDTAAGVVAMATQAGTVTPMQLGALASAEATLRGTEASVEAFISGIGITVGEFSGSGSATTVNGVNIDIQVNYHVFSWMFVRAGAAIDIAVPTEFSLESEFILAGIPVLGPSPTVVGGTFTERVSYKVSGLDIEIPILFGFNLIKTDNFSGYAAIGVNLALGGYEETLSGSISKVSSSLEAIIEDALGVANGDYDAISNKYNTFQVGLQWLVGMKYKIMDNISIFTEVKWLDSANIIAKTGTQAADAESPATGSVLGRAFNSEEVVSASNQVSLVDDEDKAATNNVTGLLNRSYVRWVFGATYSLDL